MSDPPRVPGRPLGPFFDGLPEAARIDLLNRVGAGLFNSRHAAECLTDPGIRHRETTAQFLAYLSAAVRELEAARALVVAELAGGR